jgi:glutamyl-tRNA reductase
VFDQSILSLTALVGVITIGISVYMILYMHPLHQFARRLGLLKPFRAKQPDEPQPERLRQGHVIVVGMNSLGRKIVQQLCSRGEKVLAIDRDPKKMADLPCEILLGNAEHLSVLEEAGLPHAKLLVSALQIEETNDLLAYRCRSYNIPCSINVVDLSVMDNLLEMDVTYFMIPKVDGIKAQNRKLKKMGYLSP